MERVYVDFHKRDDLGRVKLTTIGTQRDLHRLNITLTEGMHLGFYSDDADERGAPDNLLAEGTVHFDAANRTWVAQIEDGSLRHASDAK